MVTLHTGFIPRSLIPVYIGKFIRQFSVLNSLQFIVFMSISREVTTFESTSGQLNTAEHLRARLLILECMFSVGRV